MLRVISAAVLVPVALVLAYVGGWPFLILCGLGSTGILWEWARLVAGTPDYSNPRPRAGSHCLPHSPLQASMSQVLP